MSVDSREDGTSAGPSDADGAILEVDDLTRYFPIRRGLFGRTTGQTKAVDGVSFSVSSGETLGLVGESGCGKSTTGRLIVGLDRPTSGHIRLKGMSVDDFPGGHREMSRTVQIVFQDPQASLSPRMTVREIIAEPLRVQGLYERGTSPAKIHDVLESVGLTKQHADRFAHEFSGGQQQRIGIARALILEPSVIILDEPVSALDVSIRAQVINQLERLQQERDLAYLFISHDLSVVRHICDRVAVMYLGDIVETGSRDELFSAPTHPYTQALLSAIPSPELDVLASRDRVVLQGEVPSPANPPSGCRFRTRCWKAQDVCATDTPPLLPIPHASAVSTATVACHFPESIDVLAGEPIVGASRSGGR